MLATAKQRYRNAELRRLTLPTKPGQPWSVRMKQPFEWTPNGRTTLYFDGSGQLLRADDPVTAGTTASVMETFYPIHSAKVGGYAWKLVMTRSWRGMKKAG